MKYLLFIILILGSSFHFGVSQGVSSTIVMMDLAHNEISDEDAIAIREALYAQLFYRSKFKIIRGDVLKKLLREKNILESFCVTEGCIQEVARTLNYNFFIYGEVQKVNNGFNLNVKLYDYSKREVIYSRGKTIFDKSGLEEASKSFAPAIIRKVKKKVYSFMSPIKADHVEVSANAPNSTAVMHAKEKVKIKYGLKLALGSAFGIGSASSDLHQQVQIDSSGDTNFIRNARYPGGFTFPLEGSFLIQFGRYIATEITSGYVFATRKQAGFTKNSTTMITNISREEINYVPLDISIRVQTPGRYVRAWTSFGVTVGINGKREGQSILSSAGSITTTDFEIRYRNGAGWNAAFGLDFYFNRTIGVSLYSKFRSLFLTRSKKVNRRIIQNGINITDTFTISAKETLYKTSVNQSDIESFSGTDTPSLQVVTKDAFSSLGIYLGLFVIF